jgi:hypothetical protein
MPVPEIDPATRTELEAAAFRRLVAHLRERTDVQNIDLMNLAGFCRNCLSKWYRTEAEQKGVPSPTRMPGRSSTACPTRTGRRSTRSRRPGNRRRNSPPRTPVTAKRPLLPAPRRARHAARATFRSIAA